MEEQTAQAIKFREIKYRGPLSYRTLRIIGWVAMLFGCASMILAMMAKGWSAERHNLGLLSAWSDATAYVGSLGLPLFLLANFSIILYTRQNFKRLIINNAFFALLVFSLFILIYERYIVDLLVGGSVTKSTIDSLFSLFFVKKLNFNVFIDMLLCSAVYVFLTYKPKSKAFQGKKVYIFRLFCIFPILYELASIIIKGLSFAEGYFLLPVEVIPLLSSKPNLTFLAFLVIMFFIKERERRFRKKHGSLEHYDKYIDSNINSFNFSVYVAVVFVVFGLLDILFTIFVGRNYYVELQAMGIEATYAKMMDYANCWGFGKATGLMFAAPIVLLFNYTKRHSPQSDKWDIIIPIIGIVCFILLYLEGLHDYIKLR